MLTRTIREMRKGQSGLVLPIVLVLLVLGGLLIVPVLRYGATSLQAHRVVEKKAEELYSADSGIEQTMWWVMEGKPSKEDYGEQYPWSWNETAGTGGRDTYPLNEKNVDIDVERLDSLGSNYYKITSSARSPDGSTTVLATVWAAPEPLGDFDDLGPHETWEGDVYIDGDDELKAHQQVNGNVYVEGDLTLKSHSSVGGDVNVGGDFTLNDHTTVSGNVCAEGSITVHAHASIEGALFARIDGQETIELKGQARVGDIFVAGTTLSTIEIVLNNQAEAGNIYVSSNVTVDETFKPHASYGPTVDYAWDGASPPPPDCPEIPVGGGSISTYEVL